MLSPDLTDKIDTSLCHNHMVFFAPQKFKAVPLAFPNPHLQPSSGHRSKLEREWHFRSTKVSIIDGAKKIHVPKKKMFTHI